MTFIERINYLRKERNLTRTQVLKDCNLGKNSFINWENGIYPNKATLVVLAQYFNVSVDYLEGKEDEKAPTANMEGMWDLIKAYEILTPAHQQKVKDLILECIKDQMPK